MATRPHAASSNQDWISLQVGEEPLNSGCRIRHRDSIPHNVQFYSLHDVDIRFQRKRRVSHGSRKRVNEV